MIPRQMALLGEEMPIVDELIGIPQKVGVTIETDPVEVDELLLELCSNDPEKVAIFKRYCLSSEAHLVVTVIDGQKDLAITVFNPEVQVALVLPIENVDIDISKKQEKFYEDISSEEVKVQLNYRQILVGYNGNFYNGVNPIFFTARFISNGFHKKSFFDNNLLVDSGFKSEATSYDNRRENGLFKIHLPLNKDSVLSVLHEIGHFIDLAIIGTPLRVSKSFKFLNSLSRAVGGNFLPPEDLDFETIRSIKVLKEAEIRGWLITQAFLQSIGVPITNIISFPEAEKSLRSYDSLLAPQLIRYGATEEDFIFEVSLYEARDWVKLVNSINSYFQKLLNLVDTSIHIPSLDVDIITFPSQGNSSINIVADDSTVEISKFFLDKEKNLFFFEIIIKKILDGQESKLKYSLHYNDRSCLQVIGVDTVTGLIEMLQLLCKTLKTQVES